MPEKKRPAIPKRPAKPLGSDDEGEPLGPIRPVEMQGGKRVIHGSWGKLKLRFSERNKDFDESRDS
jgi:hypothetical protein